MNANGNVSDKGHLTHVEVFGCGGSLSFSDDIYRTGLEGAIAFLSEVLNSGYIGTIDGVQYVMNYQTNQAEPKD